MYLAEDRILCFELLCKENESWILKYVKSAKAETDVPDTIAEFISQRRRWLNGSFFAAFHAITHFFLLFNTDHNIFRKIFLCFEFLYMFVNLIFNWISLSSFYLIFYFMSTGYVKETDPFGGYSNVVGYVFRELYLVAIISIFITSLGNRPQGSTWIFQCCVILFAIIMILISYLSGFAIYRVVKAAIGKVIGIGFSEFFIGLVSQPSIQSIVISSVATYGMYFIASFLYLEPWHMFTSMIQYLLFLPSFINILPVYSFCNLNDISWGTKGDNKASDLGGVVAKKGADGKQTVDLDFPSDRAEINQNYEMFVSAIKQPAPKENKTQDAKTIKDDYFRNFRTKTVLLWIFSNALFIVILTSDEIMGYFYKQIGFVPAGDFNPYLVF